MDRNSTNAFFRDRIIPLAYRQLPADELMMRAAADDAEAFIALVCRKYTLVAGVCYAAAGQHAQAEDVVQEVFVELWRQRKNLRSAKAIDGWLKRTTRNVVLKWTAREARGRHIGQIWEQTRERANGAERPDTATIRTEFVRRVRQVVAQLTNDEQRVIRASENSETDAQGADLLGLNVSAYRVRLHRARRRLHDLLKKYGVAPAAGVAVFVSGQKARSASIVASLWATRFGKLKLFGLSLLLTVGLAGLVMWATRPRETVAPHEPVQIANSSPMPQPHEESLPEQNLRILRAIVAPKVCEALRPLTKAGSTITLLKTEAYDSRVVCVVEGSCNLKLPGVGEKSRIAFYYDTFLRNTFVYFDLKADGTWKSVDVNRPLVPLIIPELKLEWSVKLPGLTQAVKEFEALPKDPRGYPHAERRFIALREQARQLRGKWYRDGDPKAEARVDVDDSSETRFYRPGDKNTYLTFRDTWKNEPGSRAKLPANDDDIFAPNGIHRSADGQMLTFDAPERPWHRTPKTK